MWANSEPRRSLDDVKWWTILLVMSESTTHEAVNHSVDDANLTESTAQTTEVANESPADSHELADVVVDAPMVAPRQDAVLMAAVELAHDAAVVVGGGSVGEHIGATLTSERIAEHSFVANLPGYQGWYWAVTVVRAPRVRRATIDEVVLLPGREALLAPQWVPWSQRLRAGDLGIGDLIPTAPDDYRLVPGYVATGDPEVDDVSLEIGFGRERVMSRDGRLDTAQRWVDGPGGPAAPIARSAPAPCGQCGFYLPLAGSLKAAFGVCGNEFSPEDGRVVHVEHGCGGHSEALVALPDEPLPA
jgi:hypothetical protein